MKIVLLGATGQTGVPLIKQALQKGHSITAVVRNPDKLQQLKDDNLQVVSGDIFSVESLEPHVQDADVVMSTLGFPTTAPVVGYLKATKAMVGALAKSTGPKRLVLMHSWYTKPESRAAAPFLLRWVLIPFIKNVLDGMNEAENFLKTDSSAKDIDWTLVLPAGLSNGQATERDFKVVEDDYSVQGGGASRISRADVARYMIKCAEEDLHKKKVVSISI